MKILVCISRTPETTAKISFSEDNKSFNSDGVQYIMNPYDEWYALVRAVELREANGGEVTAIHIGDSSSDIIIRKALSIGADKAVRVDANPTSSLFVAKQIAAHAADSNYDIIFFGKETIDYNGSEVGAMVSELLDIPFVSYASKLDKDGDDFLCHRDIEGGEQVVKVSTPFAVSAAKGMAEQRIPNMMSIMKSKRKPVDIIPPVESTEKVNIDHYELPEGKSGVKLIDPENLEDLIRILRDEEKVL